MPRSPRTFWRSARRSAALSSIGAIILLGGCATPYMRAAAADKAAMTQNADDLFGGRYVALGSSFAAGPGIRPGKAPTIGAPARCGQSMLNYPTLLAEKLRMVLVDRTCSGARTEHVLGPWAEIPPQIEAVTADTRLVTLTIGGNDLSYVGSAFTAACRASLAIAPKAGEKPRTCAEMVQPTEADYAADEARLRQIVREVRKRAPKAEVVFVQYFTLLPPAGKLCAATPISADDAAILRTIGKRLAELTLRAAAAEGARVVQMNEASASHTPCDAEPWLNGPAVTGPASDGIGWHLNAAGMRATAEGIVYWLTAPQRRKFDARFEMVPEAPPSPSQPSPGFSPQTTGPTAPPKT